MCENPIECYFYRIILVGHDTCEIIQLFIKGGRRLVGGLESIKYSKGIKKENNFLVGLVKVG